MDGVRSLGGVGGPLHVGQRNGGGGQGGGAFRELLEREARPEGEAAAAPERRDEAALRSALQRRAAIGRREDGAPARHIDVLA